MSNSTLKYFTETKKPGKTKAFFICLIIASFLWLIHSLNTVYTYTVKIPVTFKNIPSHRKPLAQIPEILTLDIKASGLKLAMILVNKPFKPLEIDFNGLKTAGRGHHYILSASRLDFKRIFSFETLIKHISPDTLYFSEKTGFQKNVPVKAPLYIKCGEGFGYKTPVISPAFITVWGDTGLIQNIDTLFTQPLTLSNLSENVDKDISLIKPSSQVYSAVNEVNVFVEVDRLVEQTVVVPVRDIRQTHNQQVSVFPSRVKIRYTTTQNIVNEIDTAGFKAMIDSERINKNTRKCPVFLSMVPGNVTIMSVEPPEVEILILKRP